MEDKTLKYLKYIFIAVCVFVIGSIAISLMSKNINQKDYIGLYKDVKMFESIDKEFNNLAFEMVDNLTYIANENSYYVSSFNLNGDGGYGMRYFDEDKKYQSDNDIVKLIPRGYFFAYSEKGKFVSGDGYSYYIRTCKDLEENRVSYNSSNYFKSVVILFKNIDVYLDDTGSYKQVFDIVGMYEFHSYDRVSESVKNDVGEEVVNYINENGVVTFYDVIDNKQNISCNINYVKVDIDSVDQCCMLVSGNKKVKTITGNNVDDIVIEVACEKEESKFSLSFEYRVNINDGLWMDITYMSEVNRSETVNGKVDVN